MLHGAMLDATTDRGNFSLEADSVAAARATTSCFEMGRVKSNNPCASGRKKRRSSVLCERK
jgi:hypothetical protein